MKILFIHKTSAQYDGQVLLNLIYHHLAKENEKENVRFDLILLKEIKSDTLLFKMEWFNEVLIQPSPKTSWKRREIVYDLILNLSNSPSAVFHFLLAKGIRKKSIQWFESKKIKELNSYDYETITFERLLDKIKNSPSEGRISLPVLNIQEENLKTTAELIDWILQSENQRPLSHLKYLFFYFRETNDTKEIEAILFLLRQILSQNKQKIIFIIKPSNNQRESNTSELEIQLNQVKEKGLLLNFKEYSDPYYLLKFSEKALLHVTNDKLLNMISEVKKWNGILMQKNTLREFQTNKILERINYYLEKSSPL